MKKINNGTFAVRLLKGTLTSLLFALSVLLVTSVVYFFTGTTKVLLKTTNLLIHLLSVGLGVFIILDEEKGVLKGGLSGLVIGLCVGIAFCIIAGQIKWSTFLLNTLFCVIFGVIFGIIFVNLKNKG